MTEYAWPAVLRPSRLSFYLQHNTLGFVSPFTRATQVLRRGRARWVAEASFEPLGRVQAGVMDGLLAALAGSANTVRIWDWRREYRTGDPRSQGNVPSGPYSFSDATIFTDGSGLVVGSGNPSLAARAPRGAFLHRHRRGRRLRHRRPVTLWGALLDAQGAFVADPFPLWAGLMDTMEVTDGAEPSMALACESRLVDLDRAEVRRYTDADQQAEYPGDRFFEFVPALQEAEIRLPNQ